MPNTFDTDGRGPSTRRLVIAGLCVVVVAAAGSATAIARSKGDLDDLVPVSAALTDVGDGLPVRSDVKYHGVLVGSVASVEAAEPGRPNHVSIDLQPRLAAAIPNSVTARVVPSNAFAVSSVELVDNGHGSPALRAGDVINEDPNHPTVVLQSALTRARELFSTAGRAPASAGIGPLTALGQATQGRGQRLTDAGDALSQIATQLNDVMSGDGTSTTTTALTAAADSLSVAAPTLFDALGDASATLGTVSEKQAALTHLISAGQSTAATVGDALDNQTDRLINITTQLTPPLGLAADHASDFTGIPTRLQTLATKFYDEAWNPLTNTLQVKAIISFTPTRTYVRADCPRYGQMAGPSCLTAPQVPTAPSLLPALGSVGYPPSPGLRENRPNYAPPRDSVDHATGPQGVGPAPPPEPATVDGPNDVPPQEMPPDPAHAPLPRQPDMPGEPESVPPSQSTLPPPNPTSQPQSAASGGTAGPVGSQQEWVQLSRIIGGRANTATQLLLGPLARGATVDIGAPPDGGPR